MGGGPVLSSLIILSVVAASIPTAGQKLHGPGVFFPTIEALRTTGFIFAFAVFGAWQYPWIHWS